MNSANFLRPVLSNYFNSAIHYNLKTSLSIHNNYTLLLSVLLHIACGKTRYSKKYFCFSFKIAVSSSQTIYNTNRDCSLKPNLLKSISCGKSPTNLLSGRTIHQSCHIVWILPRCGGLHTMFYPPLLTDIYSCQWAHIDLPFMGNETQKGNLSFSLGVLSTYLESIFRIILWRPHAGCSVCFVVHVFWREVDIYRDK